MELCEIRIPTYKRPKLLKRALNSLIAQTHTNWIAIVMDDSLDQEGQYVISEINDNRIKYTPNQHNLGCAGNINQAFNPKSLVDGKYACVLEDDNWLKPNFLEANIESLRVNSVDLLLRNQEIWIQEENAVKPTNRTTRADWLENQKIYSPIEIKAYLFFFEGASNGGLFWRTSLDSTFQVDKIVTDAGLQEYCRTMQIQDNLVFEIEPLCCWSEMSSEMSLRNGVQNRFFGRGIQSIKRHLINQYHTDIIKEAHSISQRLDRQSQFEYSLIDSLYLNYDFQYLNFFDCLKQYLKSYLKYKLVLSPLQGYV